VVTDVNGYKLGMDIGGSSGLDTLARGVLSGGGYEPQTTELFREVVKLGMTVVDVGAHIGYYTILASKLVGPGGKVFAFEPEPNNYADLKRNIELNRSANVVALCKAVSNKDGRARLFTTPGSSGECSLVEVEGRPKMSIGVEIVTLDDVLGGMVVDAMKIDVDGGEMVALSGAERLLERSRGIKLFTEFWEPGLKSAGYSCMEYWDRLVGYGFEHVYLIDEKKRRVWQTDLDGVLGYLKKANGVNLLCSREAVVVC